MDAAVDRDAAVEVQWLQLKCEQLKKQLLQKELQMQGLEQQLALEREGSERDRGDDESIDLTPHIAVGSTAQQQASSRAELHQGGHWATAGHGRGEQPSLAPLIDLET